MTDEQRAIVESFPSKDRGEFQDYGDMPDLIQVEDDPIEAAALKAKMQQKRMREAKLQRDERLNPGYISKSVRFRDTEDQEYGEEDAYDSADMCYDSEEEDIEERKERE